MGVIGRRITVPGPPERKCKTLSETKSRAERAGDVTQIGPEFKFSADEERCIYNVPMKYYMLFADALIHSKYLLSNDIVPGIIMEIRGRIA